MTCRGSGCAMMPAACRFLSRTMQEAERTAVGETAAPVQGAEARQGAEEVGGELLRAVSIVCSSSSMLASIT